MGWGGGQDGFQSGGVWTGGPFAPPLSEHPPPGCPCQHTSEPQGFLVGGKQQSLHELPWFETGQKTQGICLMVWGFFSREGIAQEKLYTLCERTAFFQ